MKSEVRRQTLATSRSFAADGFEVVSGVYSRESCDTLAEELSALFERERKLANGKIAGIRNLLQTTPQVAELAMSPRLNGLLERRLHRPAFPVRAIMFDKTSDANWLVPWHQDLTIAVAERIDTPGFSAWSLKDGVHHVQPSRDILEGMVTFRLHLDDCGESDGALEVVPGSHLAGKLSAADIASPTNGKTSCFCEMSKGDALLMRPLLLHSSPRAISPSHRRILHIEYASDDLPNGLQWLTRL